MFSKEYEFRFSRAGVRIFIKIQSDSFTEILLRDKSTCNIVFFIFIYKNSLERSPFETILMSIAFLGKNILWFMLRDRIST